MTKLPETLQEYFDIAWEHAVVRRAPPAKTLEGVCRYRTSSGNRCLIGAAIPDERYDWKIEGASAWNALDKIGMRAMYGLADLQACHDSVASHPDYHEEVRQNLTQFAQRCGMTIPEVTA